MNAVPTLGHFQRMIELGTEEDSLVRQMQAQEEGSFERQTLTYRVYQNALKQVAIVLHPKDAARVDLLRQLIYDNLLLLLRSWPAYVQASQPVEACPRFCFPAGYTPKDIPPNRIWRKFDRDMRKAYKRGDFVALPVAQLPLRSRHRTDMVRRKYPVNPVDGASIEAVMEAAQADARIAQWQEELRNAYYGNLHLLLSHVCVPVTRATYDEALADARAESFRHLPLSTALSVAAFFMRAAEMWKASSLRSSGMTPQAKA